MARIGGVLRGRHPLLHSRLQRHPARAERGNGRRHGGDEGRSSLPDHLPSEQDDRHGRHVPGPARGPHALLPDQRESPCPRAETCPPAPHRRSPHHQCDANGLAGTSYWCRDPACQFCSPVVYFNDTCFPVSPLSVPSPAHPLSPSPLSQAPNVPNAPSTAAQTWKISCYNPYIADPQTLQAPTDTSSGVEQLVVGAVGLVACALVTLSSAF
jgi:hypothetical protein